MGWQASSFAFAVLALQLNSARAQAPTADQPLSIRVSIYNYVRIPDASLLGATNLVQRTLQSSGIQIFWQNCTADRPQALNSAACDVHVRRTDVTLNLIANLETVFPMVDAQALGFSVIPTSGEPATIAYVDYLRVNRLCSSTAFTTEELLGLAAAHEIGHVLLGNKEHSLAGLMRSHWRRRDLENHYWEEFQFTPTQTKRLRSAVVARSRLEAHNGLTNREALEAHKPRMGKLAVGPIFQAGNGKPLNLGNLARRVIMPALERCGICRKPEEEHKPEGHLFERDNSLPHWHGGHAFRRGLATNLHALGVEDKTVQTILRHSNVSLTMNVYVKSVSESQVSAMDVLSEKLGICNDFVANRKPQ